MSGFELEHILVEALFDYADREDAEPSVRHAEEFLVNTFADRELPSAADELGLPPLPQAGVVVTIDGQEFIVSITRSK